MTGLVLELQAAAIDQNVRVSDLLRKAKAVSKKLKASEIEEWIEHELSGYEKTNDLPPYRRICGELKAFHPARGLIPIVFEDPKITDIVSSYPLSESVSELEALAPKTPTGTVQVTFPAAAEQMIIRLVKYQVKPVLEISPAAILAILDKVRNRVLDWALELEAKGVLGQGMTFSTAEREAAQQATTVFNIGTMKDSQIQHGSPSAHQSFTQGLDAAALTTLVGQILSSLDAANLAPDTRSELTAELNTMSAQATSPRPKLSIIRESLQSVRHIIEGAGGNILATYTPQIVTLLGSLGT